MKIFMFFLLFFASPPLFAQATFKVMTYNVENFFDTRDNPTKNDDEFLPSGNRYWTQSRYYHKLQQIAKVISAAGKLSTTLDMPHHRNHHPPHLRKSLKRKGEVWRGKGKLSQKVSPSPPRIIPNITCSSLRKCSGRPQRGEADPWCRAAGTASAHAGWRSARTRG